MKRMKLTQWTSIFVFSALIISGCQTAQKKSDQQNEAPAQQASATDQVGDRKVAGINPGEELVALVKAAREESGAALSRIEKGTARGLAKLSPEFKGMSFEDIRRDPQLAARAVELISANTKQFAKAWGMNEKRVAAIVEGNESRFASTSATRRGGKVDFSGKGDVKCGRSCQAAHSKIKAIPGGEEFQGWAQMADVAGEERVAKLVQASIKAQEKGYHILDKKGCSSLTNPKAAENFVDGNTGALTKLAESEAGLTEEAVGRTIASETGKVVEGRELSQQQVKEFAETHLTPYCDAPCEGYTTQACKAIKAVR